jgi:hypothetical protein
MMQEIYENGPVKGSFTLYKEFYLSDIYQHVAGLSL